MITQKEIANILGISRTTVARAINGSSSIKEETRSKVMELVKKYNYEKNYIGSSLAVRNKKVVYALVVKSKNEFYTNEIYRGLFEASNEFKAYNITLNIVQTNINDENEQLEKLKKILKNEKFDGLIITPLAKEKIYKLLTPYLDKIKVISLGIKLRHNIPHVGPEHKKMGKIVGELLKNILRPKERILIIDNGDDKISSKLYLEGTLTKLKSTELEIIGPIEGKGIENSIKIITKYCLEKNIEGIYINRYSHDILEKIPADLLKNIKIITHGMNKAIKKLLKQNVIIATVLEEIYYEGYISGKKMFDSLIKGQELLPEHNVIKSKIVFLENLE